MRSKAAKRIFVSCLALFFLATPAEADTGNKTSLKHNTNFFEAHASQWGNDLILQKNNPLRQQNSETLMMPVDGTITSHFGPRKLSRRGSTRMHKGIDISAPKGTTVVASASGTVIAVERKRAYGKLVDIDHGNGVVTRYAHLDSYCVLPGATVKVGDTLGTVGRSGRTTGPNLHFEIIKNGVQVDPLQATAWGTNFAEAASTGEPVKKSAPAVTKTTVAKPGQSKTVAAAPHGKGAAKLSGNKAPAKSQNVTVASRGKRSSLTANTMP